MDRKQEIAEIAERFKAARLQAGLSQSQVARILDLQRPTISEIEAGRRRVSSDELAKFAELYDVGVSWLAAGQNDGEDPTVELAARELSKLKPEDLDRVMRLLRSLRKTKEES